MSLHINLLFYYKTSLGFCLGEGMVVGSRYILGGYIINVGKYLLLVIILHIQLNKRCFFFCEKGEDIFSFI